MGRLRKRLEALKVFTVHLTRPFWKPCKLPDCVEGPWQFIHEMSLHAGATNPICAQFKSELMFVWRTGADQRWDDFFVFFQTHNFLMPDLFAFGKEHCFGPDLTILALDGAG